MELKLASAHKQYNAKGLLIVPYGIETVYELYAAMENLGS